MGEVNLSINGKNYGISCDAGQEQRVAELGRYVDARLREIAKMGGASNDSHLLVLTAVVLADEIQELRNVLHQNESILTQRQRASMQDERQIVEAIEHLAIRISSVAERLEKTAA